MTTQTTYGQTVALAKALADFLNTRVNLAVEFTAEVRFARKIALSSIPKIDESASVSVIPGEDDETRAGISAGPWAAVYNVHLFIQQQVGMEGSEPSSESEAQCSLLMQLRSELIEAIKPILVDVPNAVRPFGSAFCIEVRTPEKSLPYSLERLEASNVFESETVLTFRAAV